MQTIRIEASNELAHVIISFLDTLPKDKTRYSSTSLSQKTFEPRRYFGKGKATQEEIDRYLEVSREEWGDSTQ